jgi:chaperonin GroES
MPRHRSEHGVQVVFRVRESDSRNAETEEKRSMAESVKIKPLGDRVLVEPIEEKEVVKGGILIPDSAKEKPQEARVVALGTGRRDDDGNVIPFEVKVGDIVLTSKYGGSEVKFEDKEYKLLKVDDIQAIIEK